MNATPQLDMDSFLENLVTSYEARIQNIQTVFQSSENISESSFSLFDNVHNSLNNLKKEREIINSKLCESLSRNGSLRKKDYNTMMAGILNALNEKEKEAESQFLSFIEAQKEIAQLLKNNLLGIKDITSQEVSEKIAIIKEQLSQILKLQEMRKEAVMKTFVNFQDTHNRIMKGLESLLEKGNDIHIKDIKNVRRQLYNEIN